MHCAAHIGLSDARACGRCRITIGARTISIAIIIIAIVVISVIMGQTLFATKLLSVSALQDEALHGRIQLPHGPRPTGVGGGSGDASSQL